MAIDMRGPLETTETPPRPVIKDAFDWPSRVSGLFFGKLEKRPEDREGSQFSHEVGLWTKDGIAHSVGMPNLRNANRRQSALL
jgi:hypothetical protein